MAATIATHRCLYSYSLNTTTPIHSILEVRGVDVYIENTLHGRIQECEHSHAMSGCTRQLKRLVAEQRLLFCWTPARNAGYYSAGRVGTSLILELILEVKATEHVGVTRRHSIWVY